MSGDEVRQADRQCAKEGTSPHRESKIRPRTTGYEEPRKHNRSGILC